MKTNKEEKTLEALKKAKEAVNQANDAIASAIVELNEEDLDQVAGGGVFDRVPTVREHSYKDEDKNRY